MSIIGQLIAGLIIGVLARLLLPGKEAFPDGAMGWILTALLGMAGAFIGTMVGSALWANDSNYTAGWILSILGAILLLVLVRLLFGRKNSV